MAREVQGESVLLQLDRGEYFGLDAVGTRIWQLIVEKGDLAEVERVMRFEYDVEPAVLSADLERLIEDLLAKDLIVVENPASGA
jgi:hypothetical protein